MPHFRGYAFISQEVYYLGAICECFEPPNPLSYKDWLEQFMAHLHGYADALLELHKNGLTYLT